MWNQDFSLPANHERQVSADVPIQRLQAAGKHHGSPDQHSTTDSLSIGDKGQFAYNRIMSLLIGSCWLQAQGLQNVKEDVQYDTLVLLKIIAHYSGLIISNTYH